MNRIAIAISLILLMGCQQLPSLEEVDYIIEEIEYCLEIHQWYIDNMNEISQYKRKITGDVEWHERWVDTYNRTLSILRAYRRLKVMIEMQPRFVKKGVRMGASETATPFLL